MSAPLIGISIIAATAYLTVGLFISRWCWREHIRFDRTWEAPELSAFVAIVVWPAVVVGVSIHRLAKWFYAD